MNTLLMCNPGKGASHFYFHSLIYKKRKGELYLWISGYALEGSYHETFIREPIVKDLRRRSDLL